MTKGFCGFLTRCALFAACAAASSCSSYLYYPTKDHYIQPAELGLVPEEVSFLSEDQVKLHAWYFTHKQPSAKKKPATKTPPKGVIVFFHGNGENMTSHFVSLAWILEHGYDFMIFDYQGYGDSEGEPSPEATLKDGIAALKWTNKRIKDQFPGTPLIVFGQSLGGAVALRTVIEQKNEIPIRLMFVDSTFPSYQAAGRSVLSRHWITWILQPLTYLVLSDQYAPNSRISEISPIPLVVIHGDEDQVINPALGQRVYDQALEPKEIWKVPGAKHIMSLWKKDGSIRKKFLARLDQATALPIQPESTTAKKQ